MVLSDGTARWYVGLRGSFMSLSAKTAVDQQNGHDPGGGNAWYSMGKLGLTMKNRAHLTPAVQKFMEYLPFRETAE